MVVTVLPAKASRYPQEVTSAVVVPYTITLFIAYLSETSNFFLPITNDFTARSARLLSILKCPSFTYSMSFGIFYPTDETHYSTRGFTGHEHLAESGVIHMNG